MSDQDQAQFEAEAAEYAAMGIDPAAEIAEMITSSSIAQTRAVVDKFDAQLIRQARELAALHDAEGRRAWLLANGRPEASGADRDTVNAMAIGAMRHALNVLASGYERELARNAPVTGRDVLLASMGTGNVADNDEESLQFADESEWMGEDA